MRGLWNYVPLTILLFVFQSDVVLARYDSNICCNLALKEKAFINTSIPYEDYICGQDYNPQLAPAPELLINHSYCASHCPGLGLSRGTVPTQWATLFVVFLLPAVIFSITIPRPQKIEAGQWLDYQIPAHRIPPGLLNITRVFEWTFLSICVVIPFILIDAILWISTIIVSAGPMMVGGLYEAFLDFKIILHAGVEDSPNPLTYAQRLELLITVVSGNLIREIGEPQEELFKSLMAHLESDGKTQTRLLSMMSSQFSFGSAVGAPVIYYLGAFIYTIIELENQKSNPDGAISLAFGVGWMIMVHVAIVSGCLLATNNPSISTAIVGQPPVSEDLLPCYRANCQTGSREQSIKTRLRLLRFNGLIRNSFGFSKSYETRYQPVWLWSRGANKMEWIKNTDAWKQHKWFRKKVKISWLGWFFFILFPVMVLIILPPAVGGVVAYVTPPVGWGCRSLSFMCYAGFQIVLTLVAILNAAVKHKESFKLAPKTRRFCYGVALLLNLVALLGSLFTAIGGTIMQVTGVYRNCLCMVNAQFWLHPGLSPGIPLASDTLNQRLSSQYWVKMGSTATVFMGVVSYIAWWYQRQLRKEFVTQVENLSSQTLMANTRTSLADQSDVPTFRDDCTKQGIADSQPSLDKKPIQDSIRVDMNLTNSRSLSLDESSLGSLVPLKDLEAVRTNRTI